MSCRGIELLITSRKEEEIATITALALLSGFAFMLLVEQFSSGHAHEHTSNHSKSPRATLTQLDDQNSSLRNDEEEGFDLDDDLLTAERGEEEGRRLIERRNSLSSRLAERARAFPLTLGLIIHSLTDGLALGASALTNSNEREDKDASSNAQLSVVVFVALLVHKGTLTF